MSRQTAGSLLALVLAVAACAEPISGFGPPILVTQVMDRDVSEASGMAASTVAPDRFWLLNDSGNGAALYAVNRRGHTSRSEITGLTNVDWEALGSFELDGVGYLMIADVGDNEGVRDHVALHFVEEPSQLPAADLEVAWTVTLRLADGARDIESAFVDPVEQMVYLLTKREYPAWLLRVALRPEGPGPVVAEGLGPVASIPRPTGQDLEDDPRLGRYRGQATDVSMRPDRSGLVVLTYGDAYWYPRSANQSWYEALTGTPRRVALPRMIQQEGITFSADGSRVLVTSERWPAPLIELKVRLP